MILRQLWPEAEIGPRSILAWPALSRAPWSFCAQIPPNCATTLSRKDWHLARHAQEPRMQTSDQR